MGKEHDKDLRRFLKAFSEDQQKRALWLREFVWDLYPEANELIYDNYNALAFGWSPTDRVGDTFCSIAVGRSGGNVHFGFYWGSKIADPEKRLLGEGSQYRYFLVNELEKFPKTYAKKLMKEAFAYSVAKAKVKGAPPLKGTTILKSVSPAKRKAAKTTKKKK